MPVVRSCRLSTRRFDPGAPPAQCGCEDAVQRASLNLEPGLQAWRRGNLACAWRRLGHGPATCSGPEVDTRLRVGGRAPELGDLAVADVADVSYWNFDRLVPAGGRQRAQRHGVLVVGEHIVNVEPERTACFLGQPDEEIEDLVAAVVSAAKRP